MSQACMMEDSYGVQLGNTSSTAKTSHLYFSRSWNMEKLPLSLEIRHDCNHSAFCTLGFPCPCLLIQKERTEISSNFPLWVGLLNCGLPSLQHSANFENTRSAFGRRRNFQKKKPGPHPFLYRITTTFLWAPLIYRTSVFGENQFHVAPLAVRNFQAEGGELISQSRLCCAHQEPGQG